MGNILPGPMQLPVGGDFASQQTAAGFGWKSSLTVGA
jgi:hypothetical protein